MRLTPAERLALEQAAGGTPLGAYIRTRLLDGDAAPRRAPRAAPIKDRQSLAKVLAELGASRLASNVNQLARALNTGTLEVSPDTEAALREACADIAMMRAELFKALGLHADA